MLEHLEKLVHVLFAGAEVDGIDAKPGLPFQFGGGNPEAPALLHAFRNLRMQFLGLRFAKRRILVADTNCGHGRLVCRFELGVGFHHPVKVLGLAHIVVDPFADLARTVPLETHPHFQAPESPRLLKAVHVILITLVRLIEFISQVGRLHSERRRKALFVFHNDGACVERRVEPLVRIDRDRIGQVKATVTHGPLVRQKHPTTVSRVHMEPHALAIRDPAQLANIVDRTGVRGAENTDEDEGPDAIFLVARNGLFEGIEAHLKFGVRGQCPQSTAAKSDRVDGLIDGYVALLRYIDGTALADAFVLRTIAADGIATELEPDEIGGHPSAGEISTSSVGIAAQIREPAHDLALHSNRGRSDGVSTDVLIKRRANEICDDADRSWRRGDQSHVAGVAHVRAVRQQLLLKLAEHALGGRRLLRKLFGKLSIHRSRLDIRKNAFLFDMLRYSARRSTTWWPRCRNSFGSMHSPDL